MSPEAKLAKETGLSEEFILSAAKSIANSLAKDFGSAQEAAEAIRADVAGDLTKAYVERNRREVRAMATRALTNPEPMCKAVYNLIRGNA